MTRNHKYAGSNPINYFFTYSCASLVKLPPCLYTWLTFLTRIHYWGHPHEIHLTWWRLGRNYELTMTQMYTRMRTFQKEITMKSDLQGSSCPPSWKLENTHLFGVDAPSNVWLNPDYYLLIGFIYEALKRCKINDTSFHHFCTHKHNFQESFPTLPTFQY